MRDCARFLFNHNPFYPLSAALIMVGLREAMESWGPHAGGAWWLAQWLGAYTVLLAVTAVIIIRAGKVWDDARTICLLVVLMFMAMSASFDTLCVETPAAARVLLGAGWLFSVVVTEWLTRSAQFRFPWLYRGPFYVLLGLFFVFPTAVSAAWWERWNVDAAWRVLCFPACAGLLTLTLLPAIRRGASYVDNNGSPWHWPLYPWSVFFFIAIGVCGRSYLLTLAFQSDFGNHSSFAGYYLVPFALGILIVVAEVAIVHRLETLKQFLLVAPWILVGLAMIPGASPAYHLFLAEVTYRVGSPLWLSLLAALAFLLLLGIRRVQHFEVATLPVLGALVGIGPQTLTIYDFEPQQAWPLVVMAGYSLVVLLRRPSGATFSLAWVMAVVAACVQWHGTAFTREGYLLPGHLVLIGVWLSCLLFGDAWALFWRRRLPAVWLAAAVVAAGAWLAMREGQWRTGLVLYIMGLGVLAAVTWWLLHMKLWKWSAAGAVVVLLFVGSYSLSRHWRPGLPVRAVQSLMLGAASFLIGGTISAAKAGWTVGTSGVCKREWQAVCDEWSGKS